LPEVVKSLPELVSLVVGSSNSVSENTVDASEELLIDDAKGSFGSNVVGNEGSDDDSFSVEPLPRLLEVVADKSPEVAKDLSEVLVTETPPLFSTEEALAATLLPYTGIDGS
jgi:hypothetical protein